MSEGDRTLVIHAEGKVQGVFFRAYARENARRLGVTGWVANREDGSVEGVICGNGAALAEVVALLRQGPPDARVDKLDVRSADPGRVWDRPADAYAF